MRRSFVRSLVIAVVAFAILFGGEFLLEWWRLGFPGVDALDWDGVNNAKLVDLMSPIARAYNNVLAMLLATIGLAIPLTANMHTPTLIDVFLRDRINRVVLSFMALGAAHVLWVDFIIGPKFAPMWAIRVAVYMALLGWAILIPYFFYVVRFLDPARVISRLSQELVHLLDEVVAGKRDPVAAQEAVSERLDQIGTIVLKSLDRSDREVAREGVWALKQLLDKYADRKAQLPASWFPVDRADFVGFSAEALAMLSEDRTWFEMKCLLQMMLGYQVALTKASDTVSAFSDANRVIATAAALREDEAALRLGIRVFNNFLREAAKTKNVHALYDVYHQYRVLARDLTKRPDLLREIAGHFIYYSESARQNGIAFAPQMVAFDLGYIVRRAYEAGCVAADELLERTLALPHRRGEEVYPMVVKAKLMLGGFLVGNAHASAAALVRANLGDVDGRMIESSTRDLLAADRAFFEVTDRQVNLEYVPPERRAPLQQFATSLNGGNGG
ncbi:MAG: DUF2254 domain-containing protein [Deltaproteobacteria bacterium]|nr:DUF2254 domain-containing protein [Deltaproteobacteria bacterium]